MTKIACNALLTTEDVNNAKKVFIEQLGPAFNVQIKTVVTVLKVI
jgi:hypothetical protein